MKKIGLVVLNYKDYNTTSKFLEHSKNFDAIDKIIVVDNNSPDDSYEKLLKYENSKIKVLKSEQNGGYSAGNNIGIRYLIENCDSDYIIISNPDVIFENDIIPKMVEVYDKYEKIGVVCPKMIQYTANPQTAWKVPTYKEDLISSFDIYNRFSGDPCKYDESYLNQEEVFVEAVPGSFFMISTQAIKDVQYLDERVFLYCEERILAYKLIEKGYRNILLNNISYIHDHSVSINKSISSNTDKYKILYKSKLVYNENYLNIKGLKLATAKLIFKIAILEKQLIFNLKKTLKK